MTHLVDIIKMANKHYVRDSTDNLARKEIGNSSSKYTDQEKRELGGRVLKLRIQDYFSSPYKSEPGCQGQIFSFWLHFPIPF
jgi:hypothetical protein